TGDLIAANDDFDGLDSYLEVPAPADDEYFAMVTGCCALPLDPFDPASGDTGVSNGEYEVDLGVDVAGSAGDVDTYLVDLEAGDALSVAVAGTPANVDLIGPDGELAMGSSQTAAFIYPDESPLGHQGHIGLDHVAARSGRHAIQVSGGSGGRYQVELRAASSGLSDRDDTATQELFLDFDGAVVDTTVFGGVTPQAYLSPLRGFLFRWGLRPAAENAVIDRVIEVVEENLSHDLKALAANGDRDITGRGGEHDVIITNSRDHADPGNRADVTRLVIGGSIPESGIFTVGIAQSIDPGNFDTSEVALVLLDFLGLPAGQGGLNDFAIDPSASRIDLVGVGVGNIAAHEAGHLLGNWHTDNSNRTFNIMDSGGDLAAFVGVGRDGVFGSEDDRDVDFRSDVFSFEEGFAGRENSRARTAFALSTGAGRTPIECSISGTPGDDVLTGTEYNDVICGFAGDDILLGGGGRDRLLGGVGDDTLRGAQSSDRLFGGAGNDRGFGGSGSDRLFGRSGDDRLFGQVGNDQLNGGPGIDRLGGGPGTDRCVAGEAYIDCE
ncbi:MAG: hypothetical protein OEW85_04960, partial [Acidimicrobiia bacterium]|nr:hypothetical protein [Acidimicrobiia bacterium]